MIHCSANPRAAGTRFHENPRRDQGATGTRDASEPPAQNVFNLVGPVDGASVLDLFAGSGAMGLEALSRGAERATFVEADRRAAETIDENLAKLDEAT